MKKIRSEVIGLDLFDDDDFGNFDDTDFSDEDDATLDFGDTDESDLGGSFGDDGGSLGGDDDSFDNNDFFEDKSTPANNSQSVVNTRKTAIIAVCVGVVLLLGVVAIGGKVAKGKNANNTNVANQDIPQVVNNTGGIPQVQQVDAQNIMDENKPPAIPSTGGTGEYWKQFTGDTSIVFNDEYTTLKFTVTDIDHFAASVDSSSIAVKTVLTGSLSGMTGRYELVVPYSKGSKLSVGKSFDVNVQIGTYGDKVVVGDISY